MVSIGAAGHSITAGEHSVGTFDMDHAWFTGMVHGHGGTIDDEPLITVRQAYLPHSQSRTVHRVRVRDNELHYHQQRYEHEHIIIDRHTTGIRAGGTHHGTYSTQKQLPQPQSQYEKSVHTPQKA